jgi:alpha-beta hydrolase superfamily lysophospholipase
MTFNKKKIFNFIKLLLFVYASVGIAVFYFQDKYLLHPAKLSPDFMFKFDHDFKEVNIPINEIDTINLIQFLPNDDTVSKGVVIYFHDAKDNVSMFESKINVFIKNGYEVWMPDYPGFGKSSGKSSELKINEQAFQVKRLADKKFLPEQIVIYGQQFGAGVAASLASSTPIKLLVLENPFYSIPDMYSSTLPIYPWNSMSNYKFPIGENINEISAPVKIIFTDEKTANSTRSKKLSKKINDKNTFVTTSNSAYESVINQMLKD